MRFEPIKLEEELQMYRGCFQHRFEQTLLGSYNSKNQRKASSIFGKYVFDPSISDKYVQATFTGWDLNIAVQILHWKSEPHKPKINLGDEEIFTYHPMILKIMLSPKYNGRLYEDAHEGILVTGDVDLDDVEVLLSSRTDRLNLSDLDGLSRSCLQEIKGRFDKNQHDLLQRYKENPSEIIKRLAIHCSYGVDRYMGSKEEKKPIRDFLKTLKSKI